MIPDTTTDADARFEALLRRRSGSDRVVMACEMFDFARALIEAGLRAAHPDLTAAALRVGVLHRLYGDDLPPERLSRIAHRLGGGETG